MQLTEKNPLLKRMLRYAALMLFALTTLLLILHYLFNEQSLLLRMVNYLFLPYLFIYLTISLSMLLLRQRLLAILGVVLVGLSLLPYGYLIRGATDPEADSITLMNYSIMGRNENYPAVVEVVRSECPDLALLQEVFYKDKMRELFADVECGGGRYSTHTSPSGQMLVSKWPFEHSLIKEIGVDRYWIESPTHAFALWNIHAPKSLKHYKVQMLWIDQLIELAQQDTVDGRVLIAGDFNMVPENSTYRHMKANFVDAFAACGSGPGFTFPAEGRRSGRMMGAFLRIDYLFMGEAFGCSHSRVVNNSGGSDHRPLLTYLKLR